MALRLGQVKKKPLWHCRSRVHGRVNEGILEEKLLKTVRTSKNYILNTRVNTLVKIILLLPQCWNMNYQKYSWLSSFSNLSRSQQNYSGQKQQLQRLFVKTISGPKNTSLIRTLLWTECPLCWKSHILAWKYSFLWQKAGKFQT